MGEETLVESQIEESIALIRRLDTRGDSPSSALWYYFADASEWRLLVAGPTFDQLLPKEEPRAYLKIAEAINEEQFTSLTNAEVKVVKTDNPIVVVARVIIRTGPQGIARAHASDSTFNGIFIKEILILRSN